MQSFKITPTNSPIIVAAVFSQLGDFVHDMLRDTSHDFLGYCNSALFSRCTLFCDQSQKHCKQMHRNNEGYLGYILGLSCVDRRDSLWKCKDLNENTWLTNIQMGFRRLLTYLGSADVQGAGWIGLQRQPPALSQTK